MTRERSRNEIDGDLSMEELPELDAKIERLEKENARLRARLRQTENLLLGWRNIKRQHALCTCVACNMIRRVVAEGGTDGRHSC